MKQSAFENDDMLAKWVESSHNDSAPEGFTHRVMSRVELEPIAYIEAYSNPLGKKFVITSASVFILLVILAGFMPDTGWSGLSFLSRIRIPELQLPEISWLLTWITGGNISYFILLPPFLALSFFFFDRGLQRLFRK